MINKKKTLGKTPLILGEKDAIHVAIVSVRAAKHIELGSWCKLNEHREAVSCNRKEGIGIADPFLNKGINTGDNFWLMMDGSQVETVSHTWDHKVDFSAPDREIKLNKYLEDYAKQFGLTYQQLMKALDQLVENENSSVMYEGTLNEENLDEALDSADSCDMWYEWCNETGYEFENIGTGCCPEYEYPSLYNMFEYPEGTNGIKQL